MGKNKKKKNKDIPEQSRDYDQHKLDKMAKGLEEYIELFDLFVIKESVEKEKYDKAIKVIRKAIKDLRNGNGDAVFDSDAYDDFYSGDDDYE